MANIVKIVIIALIRMYQVSFAPLLGNSCRFTPHCSRYMIDALEKKGICRGIGLGIYRILRCNPFNAGGYDPVE